MTPTRRRNVPWNGLDVFALFWVYLLLMKLVVTVIVSLAGVAPKPPSAELPKVEIVNTAEPKTTKVHPLSQLIEKSQNSPWVVLVAFFCAVIAAPLNEEFLFRLVLQRWLEKKGRIFRVALYPIRFVSPGIFSIVLTSIAFGLVHAGSRDVRDVDFLFYTLLGVGISNLLMFLFGIFYLTVVHKATWDDLGLNPKFLGQDLLNSFSLFWLIAPVIFLTHWLAQTLFPSHVTDPIPLFVFALILGTLVYRTGRLLPAVALHAFWNGLNFLILVFVSFALRG